MGLCEAESYRREGIVEVTVNRTARLMVAGKQRILVQLVGLSPFSPFIPSRTLVCEIVPPAFRVSLPTLINFLWKHIPRHSQGYDFLLS
jgi:hypothetical protein